MIKIEEDKIEVTKKAVIYNSEVITTKTTYPTKLAIINDLIKQARHASYIDDVELRVALVKIMSVNYDEVIKILIDLLSKSGVSYEIYQYNDRFTSEKEVIKIK